MQIEAVRTCVVYGRRKRAFGGVTTTALGPADISEHGLIFVETDAGITGIGETDTNPWIARECIRARGTHCMGLGLQEMLLGASSLQRDRCLHDFSVSSASRCARSSRRPRAAMNLATADA